MAGTDSFHSGNHGMGGLSAKVAPGASDAFVRSVTQPLVKRNTRPLEQNAETLDSQLVFAREQIQLCQTILARFEPRMRLLMAAAGPPKVQVPQPKLGLAKKSPSPPAKPQKFSPQESLLIANIAQRMQRNSDLARCIVIAIVQFTDAERHVGEASTKLSGVRTTDLGEAFSVIESLEISKLQGRIYPICNFHEVFKRDELLRQIFPPPDAPAGR